MITLIHGFNVKDPKKTVGRLTKYLNGAIVFNYGWRFFSVLWHNKKDAKALKEYISYSDVNVVLGHSNGCAIAVESARQGAKIDTLICINPALKVNTVFPGHIKKILVIHTKHDKATKQARFWDKVPFIQIVIPNAWGAMGADGYKGKDRRVVNWDLSKNLKDHSDFFEKRNLDYYMPKVKKWIGSA